MSSYVCSVCGYTRDSDYSHPHEITGQTNNPAVEGVICNRCYRDRVTQCAYCQETIYRSQSGRVSDLEGVLPSCHVCDHCQRELDLRLCSDCGLYKPVSQMTNETSGLCNECYSDHYTHCRDCGHLMRRERQTIDGHITYSVCYNCLQSNYRSCYYCGHLTAVSNNTQVSGHYVCNHCLSNCQTCEVCQTLVITSHMCSDGLRRCNNCLQSGNWQPCRECGHYVTSGHRHLGIRSYSYKPNPVFNGKDNDGLYYGIELECETTGLKSVREMSTELVTKFSDNEDLFYIKSDGSLRDGLEVVSHPHTVTKLIKSQWLESVCESLVSNGYKSHDTVTCGLHVHMSKSAFLDGIHETKFSYFIYESQYTRVVARRDFNSYCGKISKNLSPNRPDNISHSRYEGVNFTNSNTVEVRVFKGTLKLNTLIVCLLYCDAVYNFTKVSRISTLTGYDRDSEFIKFIQYKPKYAKLYYYLTHPQSGSQSNTNS